MQQRTFVSDAAHELKTAVAVIKSSLQLVGMRPRTPEEWQAGNERALADAARMEELVAKMLTLARVESGAATAAPDTSAIWTSASPAQSRSSKPLQRYVSRSSCAICLQPRASFRWPRRIACSSSPTC